MKRPFFRVKAVLSVCLAVCLCLAIAVSLNTGKTASASNSTIKSGIEGVETFRESQGNTINISLTSTDYMTAKEWGSSSTAAYKWYLRDYISSDDTAKFDSQSGQLAYEDREKYNMPNAVLSQNLAEYNFDEYILLNGKPLKEYGYTLVANRFTRVNSLGIALDGAVSVSGITELTVKAGCTLPTMAYAFWNEGGYSCILIEEELTFRYSGVAWNRYYPFDGYELGVTYDASEKFFYLRDYNSTYKGHAEASTFEFTTVFRDHREDWGESSYDEGYSIATNHHTYKGNLMVLDLVNPIDVTNVGEIKIRFFGHYARVLRTRNASEITTTSLGSVVETITTSSGWSYITLLAPLYANEEGVIDTLVFEFANDNHDISADDQVFIGSFELGENTINTTVYDKSFFMIEDGDNYEITYRFNARGEFSGFDLDAEKVLLNGVSIAEINKNEQIVDARWAAIQGIYQINITVPKAYDGKGCIINQNKGLLGNKVTVEKGMELPNGELLDRTYTCCAYDSDVFVEYELINHYEETKPESITWNIDPNAKDNIHMVVEFDKVISSNPYYHACEIEAWRQTALKVAGLYEENFARSFVRGGFKSSLYDSIIINGETVSELHYDDIVTAVLIQYGQGAPNFINMSIDSTSELYQELLPLFEAGSGVTIEFKKGFKSISGVRLERDYKFILVDGQFVLAVEGQDMEVFFDGKEVEEGDVITVKEYALSSSVFARGVSGYSVERVENGDTVRFTVTALDGQQLSFNVKVEGKKNTQEPQSSEEEEGGCGSALGVDAIAMGFAFVTVSVIAMMRKRKNEEKY